MKKTFRKLSVMCSLLLTALTLLINFNLSSTDEINYKVGAKAENTLKVHYIDVGQGDAILLEQGNHYMMIDGGTETSQNTLKTYLSNLGITNLDYVVGTHTHEDHIGSLDYIINSFKVGKVYFPKTTANTKCFSNFVKAVQNKNLTLTAPNVGDSFMLGNAKCTILAPNSSTYSSGNNYSIAIRVVFGNNSFLFTGDAETLSEKEILKNGQTLKSDVLKLGHHGSSTSTSQAFLNAVNPSIAVISVGVGNSYGHPNDSTINKLNKKNIETYRTDKSGTIIATSNGSKITFNTSK